MRFIRCIGLVTVVALSLAILAGCSKQANNTGVKVGVLLSTTGEMAGYGKRALNGLEMATDEINSKSGVLGGKIVLSVEDAKSEPKAAVSAYRKLTSVDGVRYIIGDLYSSTTLSVAPLAESDKVLLLAPGASSPKMHGIGQYVFRNWTSDDYDGKAIADYVVQKMHIKQVSVIYQQVDYTLGLANAFKKQVISLGGKINGWEAISPGAPEARQVVAKILGDNPPAVYVCATAKESGIVVKYIHEAGYRGRVVTNLSVESPEFFAIAKGAADGIVFSTPAFDTEDSNPRVRAFVANYKKRFGSAPDVASGHAYDAVYILAEAINRAKSSDPSKVKDAMHSIRDFPGVTGRTTFDKYGDVTKNILIKTIKGTTAVKLETYDVSR